MLKFGIENILSSFVYDDIVIIGDTNFSVIDNNVGFQLLLSLLQTYNMLPCDDLINSDDNCTYVNCALGHSSCIDHCFLLPSLWAAVNQVSILDCGANHSVHRPLCISFKLNWHTCIRNHNCDKHKLMYNIRWDKGVLSDYYALTGEALQSFNFDCFCLNC